MTTSSRYEVVVVGAGIVGLATARALLESGRRKVAVLEAEPEVARHQSGRNSGVIHSGIYYAPGSLKANLCAAGRRDMEDFCQRRGIAYKRCGKLIVATREEELGPLAELERRAHANGLTEVRRLDEAALKEVEPHVSGTAGLLVPETGIVDFAEVTRELAAEVAELGATVLTGCRVLAIRNGSAELAIETTTGSIVADRLVNCAGLQCDRVARLAGLDPEVRIIPFRGLYFELEGESRELVRALIYPVPDPRLPFLGVHLTRTITDKVKAGPNALLALSRDGYDLSDFSARDTGAVLTYPGFWKMAARWWKTGVVELRRSLSRAEYARSLQRLVPGVEAKDLVPLTGGIRAQAVDRQGGLVDDFHIERSERMIHVLNAPSPAATAALAIGRSIAQQATD